VVAGNRARFCGRRARHAVDAVRAWWLPRRLHVAGLPVRARRLTVVSLALTAASGALVVAVGAGWDLPGGTMEAAAGGSAPRAVVPWACTAYGVVAVTLVVSANGGAWKHPQAVRASVALVGGALAAETITYGWIAEGGGGSTAAARLFAWIALVSAGSIAVLPQRLAARHPLHAAWPAAAPFAVALGVWATASRAPVVALPHGLVLSQQDVFAQGVILVIGATAGAVGILVLWALVSSARQARDMGEGIAAIARHIPWLFGFLLGAKVVWLLAAYLGVGGWDPGAFGPEGPAGWLLASLAALWCGAWLWKRDSAVPGDAAVDRVMRWFGIGFAAVFVLVVVLGLTAAVCSVVEDTWAVERLNSAIDWLLGSDPPVAYWGIVATVAAGPVVMPTLRRRGKTSAWTVAALTVAWAAPRAAELAGRILELDPPLVAPRLASLDTAITVVLVWFAARWWVGRRDGPSQEVLLLVLVVSTLAAHPFRLLPAGWRTGGLFYLLIVYPPVYRFLFDAGSLNDSAARGHPERVVRETAFAAALLATTSMLIGMGVVGPGSESLERAVLGQVGRVYLLVPAAALAVAGVVAAGAGGPRPHGPSTRRDLWAAVARRIGRAPGR